MAAKQELVAPLEIEIGVFPRLKEKDPTVYTSCVDPEVSRDAPVAYSAGTSTSEFLNWATPPLIKQGADLRHQPQELGKPLESIPSKWRDSCLPQLSKGEDVETPPFHSKEAAGRYRHQAGWEAPHLQQACEGQGSSKRVKEETPDEDTADLVMRCQSFRGFCYPEAQGPKGAYVRLRELCLQWLEPERHTKEEILELVILEQFLTILPAEMQNWLREIGPRSCSQAVALAEEFLLRQGEAKNGEQQVPTPPGEVDASFSKAIQTRFDASQRPLCREVKQESEADTCFLGGDRRLSEPRPSGVPSVKAEGEKVENDSEIVKMDTQPAKWRSKSMVAEGDQFQEVREQIVGGKGCDPCHKKLVSPSRQNPHQSGFPNSGESVDYESKLITHQRIQAGEKPYKCSECGQCQSPLLITPQRFHTEGWMTQNTNNKESAQGWVSRSRYGRHSGGENPHQCADCGKSFHYKSQLIRHQRVHSGEKPYPCSACGKSFSQRQHLIDHQKLHTGKNPHRCSDCGKSFSYMSQLLVHQRSHTGEKPFPCLDCAQHFSRRAHLLRHQRRIHGRENLC